MGINATTNDPVDNDIDTQKKEKSQSEEMRDTFLKMIVTQMQNQDPTNPMDNSDLTSQLAQIATLESMNNLNDTVSGISKQINSGQSLQAAQLVGKNVLIPGSDLVLAPVSSDITPVKPDNPLPGEDTSIAPFADDDKGDDSKDDDKEDDNKIQTGFESSPFGFFLAKPADKIEITIRDRNKGITRTITIEGETKPDIYDRTWDGRNDKGELVLDTKGKYTFEVKASLKGEEIAESNVVRLKYAKVNGVTPGAEAPLLDVGIGHSVLLSEIFKVYPDS
ncbi:MULTISPECIES: flagellar hook assembly protein FlgD [unclassified Morganella (in: enterobacteria)]|uniref:flagellar hook assembly protein FlgD n=1 Tax=unclassified Morganella (in: enterobacteria) TaxID=2676694 RepID=UPI002942181D|nr:MULTISPECIES: flagellar hook capping FlgD N-terminal domain-containing protein [unclassified Morganella (in: enterobacteria)]